MPGFDLTKLFVNMINGKTGVVKLNAEDVHALPDDTVIPEPSDALPQDLGEATPGVSDEYARADHVHNMSGSSSEIASITFPAAWTDSGNGYYTAAPTIDGVTLSAESKIDLQITAAQFLTLQADGVENLYVENNNAALTAYAVGGYPSAEITLQCMITGTVAPTPPVNPSLDMIYPIGSIYTAAVNINPSNTIGGTWERVEDTSLHITKDSLWENPDPSAEFAAQTIALDLSSYEKVLIKVRYGAASGVRENNFMQFVCDVGEGTILWVMNYANNFTVTFTPGVNFRLATVTTTGVEFSTCAIKPMNTSTAPTTGNGGCIPWSIYGIGVDNSKYVWKRTA